MQNWVESKSIPLSQFGVLLFAGLLAALDLGGWWIIHWFAAKRALSETAALGVLGVLLACSVLGWLLLWAMWKLLGNLKSGSIFTEENVRLLQRISLCCTGAAVLCLLGCFFYLPFLFAVAAAAFMSLIVRIVRNVFQTALAMKAELDFTV